MKRVALLFLLTALLSVQVFGQDTKWGERPKGVQSHFMAEIGLRTGLSYEQRLGHSFTLLGRMGYDAMLWATVPDGIVFQGMFPTVRLSPRWYYSPSKYDRGINRGGYIALEMSYTYGAKGGIFTGHWDNVKYVSTVNILQPSWGYNWVLSDHWAVKYQVGLSIGQIDQGYIEFEGDKIHETRGWNAVVMDLGVLYVF